jgi:hypothetical protein
MSIMTRVTVHLIPKVDDFGLFLLFTICKKKKKKKKRKRK